MKVAHLVISIIEADDGQDAHANFTYSGGSDLTSQYAKNLFGVVIEGVDQLLSRDEADLTK